MHIEVSTYEEVVEMSELNELLIKMKKEDTTCHDLKTMKTEAGSLLGTSLALFGERSTKLNGSKRVVSM